jgi:hypothetical protein
MSYGLSDFKERLKQPHDMHPEEVLVSDVRQAIRQALNNSARRRRMIPFLKLSNPINRILGKYRYRLLGPARIA